MAIIPIGINNSISILMTALLGMLPPKENNATAAS